MTDADEDLAAGTDGLFWDVAQRFLADGAERSTMMGFPCLRQDGAFFASMDHRSGNLVVKLPAARVEDLVEDGTGLSFAPSGRRFREWVEVPTRDEALWDQLMAEARAFVEARPG